ncbi:MAG: hypothetical protein V4714_08430 [Bacteroidota bacterium]
MVHWQTDGSTIHVYQATTGDIRRSVSDSIYVIAGSLSAQVHTIRPFDTTAPWAGYAYRQVGRKSYELKDHLGNVRVVVSDEKKSSLKLNSGNLSLELAAAVKSYRLVVLSLRDGTTRRRQ